VPIDRGALRFTVTAANTEEQVCVAVEALRKVRDRVAIARRKCRKHR
jgi:hypothetical protein